MTSRNYSYKGVIFLLIMMQPFLHSCTDTAGESTLDYSSYYYTVGDGLEDCIVNDYYSPPVASRIYAYAYAAPFLILQAKDTSSISKKLHGVPELPANNQEASLDLASVFGFYYTARELVFTPAFLDRRFEELEKRMRLEGISDEAIAQAKQYGKECSAVILKWASTDHYKQSRAETKYVLQNKPGCWEPTPPMYMDAIEPNWKNIRTFWIDTTLDLSAMGAPTEFSENKGSRFYKEMQELYQNTKQLSDEQRVIAAFWDCNPIVSKTEGHVLHSDKKLTPGGHWMKITTQVCKMTKKSYSETVRAHFLIGTTLADAFISCWTMKYTYHYIRPITAIHKLKDRSWEPLLQTPPFPEFPSGHSVVSAASAEVLTQLFGDSVAYVDSAEVAYGIPKRSFTSFRQASSEAAISRIYGGIHFFPAVNVGKIQGQKIGEFIIKKAQIDAH